MHRVWCSVSNSVYRGSAHPRRKADICYFLASVQDVASITIKVILVIELARLPTTELAIFEIALTK